ncbi:MAG: hypothetical protein CMN75_05485 [Spirochaeta sp.]|nr:hypothetical protein [Spirochaeta sp.]RPG06501.1 MAG: hypothetical protein CBC32_011210 [Proteobacteria bacterium TMED72]
MTRAGLIATSVWLAAWLLATGPAFSDQSEVRRLEVVGAVALHGRGNPRDTPKDRAVQEGLINGVSRVGADLLLKGLLIKPSSPNAPDPDSPMPDLLAGTTLAWESPIRSFLPAQELEEERVKEALGRNMVPYTRGFRILEDQGERPALFTQDPDAATEYVVVMEVQVEVARVRQRLEQTGLIASMPLDALTGIELELSGLDEYALYQAVLELLAGPGIEAASVTPEAFYSQHARIRVEGAWTASELNRLLQAAAPAELNLVTLEVQDAEEAGNLSPWQGPLRPRLAISAAWRPPPAAQEEGGVMNLEDLPEPLPATPGTDLDKAP